jgi:hypothetical protein
MMTMMAVEKQRVQVLQQQLQASLRPHHNFQQTNTK